MTRFTSIDLDKLPPPNVIEEISFEQIFNEMLDDLRARLPDLTITLESDPAYKLLEVAAYREVILRSRINDAARAVMLAYATGSDLVHLAALFGVEQEIVDPGNPDAIPPIPPTFESDERLRSRTQLSLEGFSTAGPVGAYLSKAFEADPRIKDIDVSSPQPGVVNITALSSEGRGSPSGDIMRAVALTLNDDAVRPLTDSVSFLTPQITNYRVEANLFLFDGPSRDVVLQAAQDAVEAYTSSQHRLGRDITLSGLYAALHQPGVQRVELIEPASDLVFASNEAGWAEEIVIKFGGRDE